MIKPLTHFNTTQLPYHHHYHRSVNLSFFLFLYYIMIIVGTVRRTKTHNFTKQTLLDLISNTKTINNFALRLHATLINSLEESRNNNNFQHVFNIGYLCLHDGNGIPHTFIFEVLTKVSKIWHKTLRNVVSIYIERDNSWKNYHDVLSCPCTCKK